MTTRTWSSGNLHDTDANYRIWGSELSAKFAEVGLVQTADTGQINWATAVRPGVATDGGYEIWRWNDAMQATAPIFMKVWYGTGGATTYPRIRVEVGTGSNGSGTITGTGAGVLIPLNHSNTNVGSATPTPSYMCHTEGFFGISWKRNSSPQGCFVFCRTVDATGTPDGHGLMIWGYGTTSGTAAAIANMRVYRFASPASVIYSAVSSTGAFELAISPGWLASSTTPGGDKQIYLCWGAFPEVRPLVGIVGVLYAEFAEPSTFTCAMVGTTPRTYICLGHRANNIVAGSTGHGAAMLWE